jgi:alpha-glucosidase
MLYVNQRALEQQLDTLIPLFEKWGVDGIKFGFVQVGSQHWTNWLHEAVKKCALHHLVVDIHDEYRPTGFSRTYPNLLTQEGVRGNEEFPDATHNVTLPFTRFVAGAADYTVCYYKQNFERRPVKEHERFLKNTSAHQLALPVVFYSPLQFMYWYDKPSDCRDEPELEFFDALPTTWDDTKVVQGEIGEYITIARRKGNEWFVGTMNNTLARKLDIPLSFLETGKKYVAHIYSDDEHQPTRTKVRIDRMIVNSETVIKVLLKGNDGQAMRFIETAS